MKIYCEKNRPATIPITAAIIETQKLFSDVTGLFFSQYIFTEILQVFISDQNVKLLFKEKEEVIEKKDISAVYLENKDLVVLDHKGTELYREQLESKSDN